jgi:hypothetical protein
LDYFYEKGESFDPLKQVGSKYRQRVKEFDDLRAENLELM